MTQVNVGVYGATGYTGLEIIKRIRQHPHAALQFATSESYAGQSISRVYPVGWDIPLVSEHDAPLDDVEAVFCCLPHAAGMPIVQKTVEAGVRVIDLSADFRLADADTYQTWYGVPHTAAHLLPQAVYGLSEVNRGAIKTTNLLANPGCYPTSILLGLYPLLSAGALAADAPLISDSKSGISGAGRKLSLKTHFVEANENLSPYSIGQTHRHLAEINQTIAALGNTAPPVIFSPHLVPINQGMLSTIYITLSADMTAAQAHALFAQTYAAEPLVRVLPLGDLATFAHTQHTDGCAISVTGVDARHLIVCSSIDNLGKGAAGQAVQNFNSMFGFDETTGLFW